MAFTPARKEGLKKALENAERTSQDVAGMDVSTCNN